MWGPTEICSGCGGSTIRECDGSDVSVGYNASEWRCMDCGDICEVWTPEPMALPSRKPSTVATLLADLADLELDAMRKKVA